MKTITKITPRYAETDQMGVIHHSVYPVWYECGRVDFCKALGIPYHEIEKRNIRQAILNISVEYKYPAFFGDELTIITKLKAYSKIKMEFEFKIYNQNEKLINTGTTVLVWLSNDLKPFNISKEHNDIYEAIVKSYED